LNEKGFPSNISILLQELRARDERDRSRFAAPLRPAEDARQLDSSDLSIEQVVSQILRWHGES
jgi:cytidylate kinase